MTAAASTVAPPERRSCRHGLHVPRGLSPRGIASSGGRFGRLFPCREAHQLREPEIEEILWITNHANFNLNRFIPAGYTYLGQFIDHDITFDATSKLDQDNDPDALSNFRTPRLDLDSLYGSGPAVQPYLYDWDPQAANPGVKLLVERSSDPRFMEVDLPRNCQGRALIGDARNDENAITAQLHLMFIHFHNRVVDWLADPPTCLRGDELFDRARELVCWHYQWVVARDFLLRVVGESLAASVLNLPGAAPPKGRKFYKPEGTPYIPVEFSAAAFRFGHSMVRDTYTVNDSSVEQPLPVFENTAIAPEHLGGFRQLPCEVTIDWAFFFKLRDDTTFQQSRSIDLNISGPLFGLPPAVDEIHELVRLNLKRGAALGLPSGQEVADAMGANVVGGTDLTLGLVHSAMANEAVQVSTPLWYYILAEAANVSRFVDPGRHLGEVGGRIVAEVLVGLLEADERSYLHQPGWEPCLPKAGDIFRMADIVRFAYPDGRYGTPG